MSSDVPDDRPARLETPQKRALFYVFDAGTGIGHLRRLACLARQLQGRVACLVVTGHRSAAHWFVADECEYVHLPSWDSVVESRAGYWGRQPFIRLGKDRAVRLRREILEGIVRGFEPDAIFVDHLPLGAEEELAPILADTRCRKYLVTRAVLNETEDLRGLILGGKAHHYLKNHYARIFAAADPRVFDFLRQYNIAPEIRDKTMHTGYITQTISAELRARTRAGRGLTRGELWVVASAGGGQLGERLIEACVDLAGHHEDIAFDIVLGPRSNLVWADQLSTVVVRNRLRIHKETPHMACLNASADLVISSGGYNTILEALQGDAEILCFPLRQDRRDEQYQHAERLRPFVNIEVSMDLGQLPVLFERAVARLAAGRRADRRAQLDFGGAATIERIVREDLGL
jgi:predicted glycosyltransferase